MKKELIVSLCLLLLTIPAVKSLFQPGGYTSHDLTHHVIRQIDMDRMFGEGQFPPRWSGDLNKGFGYPLFNFNYPLPPLLGEIFVKLGFGYVESVKAILFLSIEVSALGMYLFLRSLFKSKLSAFLGAVFYIYAPIRFVIIYVSAAVGGALALAFVPFIFWSIVELDKKPRLAVLVGSLSLAGLIMAHNVTALMFAPVILGFSFLRYRKGGLGRLGKLGGLGVGMAAFFWLPAVFEKQFIRWDVIFNGYYRDHFPEFWQLIHSPWGYGLDNPKGQMDGMSFQIGLVQILVMVLVVGLIWARREVREIRVIGGFVVGVFLGSLFLILDISTVFWDHLPFLSLVQYPWRFLSVAIFAASLGVGLLVKYVPFEKILFVTLLVLVLFANRNHLNINQVFNPGVEYYQNQKPTTTSFDEDLPIWAKPPTDKAKGKLEFLSGSGKIYYTKNQSTTVVALIDATVSGQIRFNQFYFPGWQFSLDNQKISFDQDLNQSQGLPAFAITEGSHFFIAEFRNTPIRSWANSISVISLLIWLGLLFSTSLDRKFVLY